MGKSSSVNVNLQFTASADRAKKEIAELQQSLHTLVMSTNNQHLYLDNDINKAVRATAELQAHLEKAVNINTGNLDFSKLSQSLKSSGKNLQEYGEQLLKLGPQGEQAFMKLANSISQSEVPLKRVSERLQKFGQTLANTARWQLSSSILQGFTGAIQSAYNYAQDLNESLNNIRIVTGASIDDMAQFAKEANKAAKALNATTTEYTNASLIYYQQGLSDAEVKERANVTIKLANISRQSAEDVSNQMTAIWNNFYDGSESLEHYADVLSALGAVTASSTEEIAGGLEKFAAIADTIGLSYDYAAAALATLTSNTRESEEVVGTALKTIFARIQGLKLGETLEDGTNLNKYSQALMTVGINIKDTTGNLKDMDMILNEMGEKWNTLSRDQQAALAQTVAGTRQYNQLMALMANWNNGDSDSFQANLATTQNASGTLDSQADIYAESWEAARDRVTAAAEEIFDKLLNDESFIKILNSIEKIIGAIDTFIDSVGGLRGVLLTVGAIATKVFSQQISQGLTNAAYTIKMSLPGGKEKIAQEKAKTIDDLSATLAKGADDSASSQARKDAAKFYQKQLTLQSNMIEKASQMSDIEKTTTQNLMDQLKTRGELLIASAKAVDIAKSNTDTTYMSLYGSAFNQAAENDNAFDSAKTDAQIKELSALAETSFNIDNLTKSLIEATKAGQSTDNAIKNLDKALGAIGNEEAENAIREIATSIKSSAKDSKDLGSYYAKIAGVLKGLEVTKQKEIAEALGASADEAEAYVRAIKEAKRAEAEHETALKNMNESANDVDETIQKAQGAQKTWGDALVSSTSAIMAWINVINMAGSIVDTLTNDELTAGEKLKQVFSALLAILPSIVMALSSSKTAVDTLNKALDEQAAKKAKDIALSEQQAKSEKKVADAKEDTADAIQNATDNNNNNNNNSPFEFTDSKGKQRKYSGRTNKDGKLIDDSNNLISNADIEKYKLQGGTIPGAASDAVKDKVGNTVKDKVGDAAGDVVKDAAGDVAGEVGENVASSTMKKGGLKNLMGKSVGKTTVGKLAGGAAVAAAVIVAAAITYKELDKLYKKNELAAEEARKAAEELKAEYSKAKTEYEKLMNSVSKYSGAKDSMKDLTRGTTEFTEALMSANEEALSLIDNYGDIIAANGGYKINSDGLIEIDETALEAVRKEELNKMQGAQAASMLANRKAKEARLKADATELNRKKIKSNEGSTGITGEEGLNIGKTAAVGAGTGAAIGAFFGPWGALIGAGIGGAAGALSATIATAIAESSETEKESEAFNTLAEEYEQKGAAALTDENIKKLFPSGDEFGNLADELIANREEVSKLVKEMAESNTLKRAENLAMANQILASNTKVQESEHAEDIGAFVADQYGQKSDEAYDKYMNTKMTNFWGKRTADAENMWNRYAEEMGISDLNGYKVKNYKKDGSVVYEYIDEEGKKQKATVTQEQLAAKLAAMDAAEATEGLGERAVDILQDVDRDTVKLLAGAKNKDMSRSTIGDLQSQDASRYANLDESELHELGFTGTKEEIIKAIQAQQNLQINDIKNLANDYGAAVGAAMGGENGILTKNADALTNVTQGTLKQYAGTMDKIVTVGGTEMLGQFNTLITGLTKNNANQADAIMAAANSIDWTQGETAIQDFNYQLLKMGVNIDENSDEWKNLVTSMQSANISVLNNDLDSVRKKLTEIKELANDIEIGGVVSDEDYDNLIKYNAALADQFVMTTDGYMYAGKKNESGERVKDIDSITDDIAMRQLEGLRKTNAKAKAASAAMTASGYNFKSLANGVANATDQTNAAAFLAGDEANAIAMREALGISKDEFTDLSAALGGADPEAKKNAQDKLKQIYTDLLTIQGNDAAGQYSSTRADEVWASTQGYDALEAAKAAGTIDATVADTYMQILQDKAAEVELEEAERYAAVNHELETMEQHLSTINKLKDRASNSERIALIAKEADALKKQADAQAAYLEEVKNNLATDKTALLDYGFTNNMFNTDGSIDKDNYNAVYTAQLEAYQQAQEDLALKNINEAEFAEKEKAWQDFNKATDKYKATLSDYANAQDTLIDSNNQFYTSMVTAYTETLSNAGEELSKYTTRMEHYNSVLDHYKNLSTLIGKETDYAAMNEYLEGQAHLAENTLKVSKASYEMYKNEAQALKDKMDAAVSGSDNFKTYKEQWEAAEEKAREAENQMLADLSSWAEAEKSILENTLADLGKTLEESLTGGLSFDKLNTQMERAASLQEEYLTTTNKIYETTKMMRTAQQAIDTSTNAVAKEKLKGFINETKSMQEQGKLSQYELDMQQAKYDLLVAEIALEEAQNAKSTVRLQRDSEGNFGYVYTADAGAVSEAQQQFDSAQNTLYNKGLEGANNYTQKYQETMSQMTDTLSQIQSDYLAGSYESEEAYQNAMAEAKSYYFEKLQGYSELYSVAVAADSKIAEEAWSTEFAAMTQSTTEWSQKVDEYITGVTDAFTEWEKVASAVEETTGKDLSSIAAHVDGVTSASDTLAKALLGENGEGGLIAELTEGFETVATTIANALNSWIGITITTGQDGTVTVTPKTGAATGGLTSAWGPEGKMLMVHENELILNSDQTNKFFENLALMESILATIDSYAINQQLGGILSSPGYTGGDAGNLEQNVKIEASFPGVTDRNEIEEAFNNLVNKASQYANRK